MGKLARTAVRYFIWLAIPLIALAASVIWIPRTTFARKAVCRWLSDFVSHEIRGALVIGRIDSLSLDRVVASHVSLWDQKGVRVVSADQVIVYPDFVQLFKGTLRFKRATLARGTVRLEPTPSGLPTLLESLEPENPSTDSTREPLHAIVEGIELSQVAIYGEVLGLKGLRAEKVFARGRLEIQRQLEISLQQARGKVVRPFPFEGSIDDINGTISDDPYRGMRLNVRTSRARDRALVMVVYALPKDGDPAAARQLDLAIRATPISGETLQGLGFEWIAPLRVPLTGYLRLYGVPSELALEGKLTTEAGNACLRGQLSAQRGVSVELTTRAIDLAKAISSGPPVTVSGSAKIETGHGPYPQVDLQLEPLLFAAIALPAFRVRGTIESERFRVQELTSDSGGQSISGSGAIGYGGDLVLSARAAIADIGREPNIKRQVPGARGTLQADISLSMPDMSGRQVDFQGRVVLRNLRYGPFEAKMLELTGSAHGDPELPRVDMSVRASDLLVSGYSLGDTEFSLKGDRVAYRAAGKVRIKGQETFRIDAIIQADRESITANAEQIEFSIGDRSWRGAARNLKLTKGESIGLELLRLANRSQRLEVQGEIRFQGEDRLNAQLQDFDLEVLHALLGPAFPIQSGRADAQVELRGDVSQPQLSVQGALRDSAIKELKPLSGVYFLSYQEGHLQVDAEADLGARGTVSVSGTGELDREIRDPLTALLKVNYQVQVASKSLDLSAVGALLGVHLPVTGSVSGSCQVAGTRDQPNLQGALQFRPLQITGWSPLSADVDFSYATNHVVMKAKLADSVGELANINAETDLVWAGLIERPENALDVFTRGPWTLSGRIPPRNLRQLPRPLSELTPWPVVLQADFRATREQGNISVESSFQADWDEAIPNTTCAQKAATRFAGKALLYGGFTYFSVSGYLGKKHIIETDGALETPLDQWINRVAPPRPGQLSASAKIDIPAIESFPWLCEYGTGGLEATVDFNDLFTDRPSGTLQLDGHFFPKPTARPLKRWQRKKPPAPVSSCASDPLAFGSSATIGADGISLSGLLTGCRGGPTRFSARLPVLWRPGEMAPTWAPNRDLNARVELTGAQFRPLLERLPGVASAEAAATGTIVATGKPDQVIFSGALKLSGGSVQLAATGQRFTDLSGDLIARGNWVELKGVSVRDGEGHLKASGSIGLQGLTLRRAKLALLLDQFPIRQEVAELAWLTGTADIDSEINPQAAKTTLSIRELTVTMPENSRRNLQQLDAHPDIKILTTKAAESGKSYVIEVRLDGSKGFWVKRNDFSARVRADLELVYIDPELTVNGDIDFDRGEFVALDKNFKLNGGSLTFDGSPEIDPEVYLSATQITKGAADSGVEVTVSGTLSEPKVSFYSQDCEGEDGALTYLLTGRCSVSESEAVSQDLQGSSDAFAWGLTGGVLTLGARRGLGDVIESLSVEKTTTAGQGSRTRVSAGFNADGLIPAFMRNVVQHAYVQGGVATLQDSSGASNSGEAASTANSQTDQTATQPGLETDFLLELSFPYHMVWSGKLRPPQSWGSDLTWEP